MFTKIVVLFLMSNVGLTLSEFKEPVDLTWDFDSETIYWKGTKKFSYTNVVATDKPGYWYAANEFCAGEHGGTHLDAPYHFNKQGWKVGEVPINRLITKGAIIDLSNKNIKALTSKHLEDWQKTHGEFETNTVLFVKFGWSQYWTNRTAYLALDKNGNLDFPGISPEAATWIANSGKIVGVGIDTSSVDPGSSSDMLVHRTLSKKQIYNLENVKLLADLPAKGFTVICLPMKLKDGTGAPTRILAVPKHFL